MIHKISILYNNAGNATSCTSDFYIHNNAILTNLIKCCAAGL
jgi:hypothetical protein